MGSVPKENIPGVAKGLESVMGNGVLAGFPVIGCKATLMDGAYHDVDSSVMAFEIAGRAVARKGLKEAGAKLMEPMMKVEVTTPEDYMGDVIGDINSRRGMVGELGERGNMKVVRAKVPLANISSTSPRCAARPRAARRTRWSSSPTRSSRPMSRRRSCPSTRATRAMMTSSRVLDCI